MNKVTLRSFSVFAAGCALLSGFAVMSHAEETNPRVLDGEGGSATTADKAEIAALQGTWEFVIYEENGSERRPEGRRFVITGDHMSYYTGKTFTAEGTLKLDPAKSPKQMDFALTTGQLDLKIYVLAGNYMIACGNRDGKIRPKVFQTGVEGGGAYLLVLKRVPRDAGSLEE